MGGGGMSFDMESLDELSLSVAFGFSIDDFEAHIHLYNGRMVRRTSSEDEQLHVVTYVRDATPGEPETTLVYTTRLFVEGVAPALNTPDDDYASKDQALYIHAELVESHLAIYAIAPCLWDGAL
jgi:hypothetical protein